MQYDEKLCGSLYTGFCMLLFGRKIWYTKAGASAGICFIVILRIKESDKMTKEKMDLTQICDGFMDKVMDLYDVPGVSVGVMIGDRIYTGVRGFRNYITKDPLEKKDVFHCASVSKMFTGTSIMKLVDEKKLSLDDKLVDVLPFLHMEDERSKDVKIYQLLSHISGMHDVPVEDWEWKWGDKVVDPDALRNYAFHDEVCKRRMLWEPESNGFMYSSIAYELLGIVIQEVSGMPFEQFVKENCFKPSGMDNTTVLTIERTGGSLELNYIDTLDMAMPHERDKEKNIIMAKYYPFSRQHMPSSTLTTTAEDLLKWGRFNLDRKMFSGETYEKMWSAYATVPNNGEKMGLGWFMREQEGCRLMGHEGTDIGFRASFWMCPEHDMAISVLSNVSAAPVKRISKTLFAELIHWL